MLNQRLAAAKSVAAQLFPAEELIEQAIITNARLAIAIVEGRKSARLPITAGQQSLAAVAEVSSVLIEARDRIAVAHQALARDKLEIGLGTRGMGDWGECPPATGEAADVPATNLRVVA